VLRPGRLVVVDTPPDQLGGALTLDTDARVRLDGGPLTGVNYLVLRVECREERDDWRFPELDSLIRAACVAKIEGDKVAFRRRSREALVRAASYDAFVDADRPRVAALVRKLLDDADRLGVVPVADLTLDAAARVWLLPRDAPELLDEYDF
jgi:hypothetical protein